MSMRRGDVRGAGAASKVAVMCFLFASLFGAPPCVFIGRSGAPWVSFQARAEWAGGVEGSTRNELEKHHRQGREALTHKQ